MSTRELMQRLSGAAFLVILTACQASPAAPLAATAAPSTAPVEDSATSSPEAAAVLFSESALAVKQTPDSNHHLLAPADPATGLLVEGYEPIDLGSNFYYTFAPDRKTMIFSSYAEQEGSFAALRFFDLDSWTEATGLLLPTRGWTSAQAVNEDGTRYALATVETRTRHVWLVDARKHILLESIQTPLYVTAMGFASNGQGLMIYGNPENFETGMRQGPPAAELRSSDDLDVIWARELDAVVDGFQPNEGASGGAHEPGSGNTFRPAVVFDPQAVAMYVIHADVDRLTRVEFARKRVLTQDIRPAVSWFERLLALGTGVVHSKVPGGVERKALLSQDARTLYIAGQQYKLTPLSNGEWDFEQIPLALRALAPSTASVVWTSEAAGASLQFSDDLGSLFLGSLSTATGEMHTYEVSLADGVILNEAAGLQMQLTRRMDGTPLLVATEYGASAPAVLSSFTLDGVPLGEWSVPRSGAWILVP